MKKIIIMLSILFIVGCSSYPNYKQNGGSTIGGGRANFFTFTLGTSGHLSIKKIDNIKTGGLGFDKYVVKSGKHILSVNATNGKQNRSGNITVNLLPYKKYQLEAFFDSGKYGSSPARIELMDAINNSKLRTYYLE